MSDSTAGAQRDTKDLARKYAKFSRWQHSQGLALIDFADPRPGQSVVDLGCGTGTLTVELARRVGGQGRVVGIDPSPARLAEAEAKRDPALTQLCYEEAKAEAMPGLADASVDLIYANYSVHWILAPRGMFREAARILRPGGRFVAEFLDAVPPLILEFLTLMPLGEEHKAENNFMNTAAWRDAIAPTPLEIDLLETLTVDLHYTGLDDFYGWLEGTSQGAFDRAKLTGPQRQAYAQRFPGPLDMPLRARRFVLRKKG